MVRTILVAVAIFMASPVWGFEVGEVYLVKSPIDKNADNPREVKIVGVVKVGSVNYIKTERCISNEKCFEEWVKDKVFSADVLVKLPKKE